MLDITNRDEVAKIIETQHWQAGKSVRCIEREHGIKPTRLNWWCQRHGIRLRTRTEQVSITNSGPNPNRPHGETHWAFGLNKHTSAMYAAHSARMLADNPIKRKDVARTRAVSVSATYRQAPTPAESRLVSLLQETGIAFIFQHPIGKYIVDVAIPAARVILELDGKGHSYRERRAHDIERDTFLIGQGWDVVRVCQRKFMANPYRFFSIIKQRVPGLQTPGSLPATPGQYGVLWRHAKNPAGVRLCPHHRPRVRLAHDSVDPA